MLASHNSWTYLKPRKWWMKLIGFTARCQNINIFKQEKYNIKCFDLRVRINSEDIAMCTHGLMEYCPVQDILPSMEYLNNLAVQKDTHYYIRILHDVRNKKQYENSSAKLFSEWCSKLEKDFPALYFFGGNNLYNNEVDYTFNRNYSIYGHYGSVTPPTWFWGLFPWLYAKLHNHSSEIPKDCSDTFCMIDFVQYWD